jgi:hypothetical protein
MHQRARPNEPVRPGGLFVARRSYPGKKRRTREHVIADLSVNHVERQALLCGFTVERSVHDYGIDVSIHTFDQRGEVENGEVLVQVKASDRVRWLAGGRHLSFRVEKSDLLHWLQEPLPVMLVVYDALADRAYYLPVQEYFEGILGFDVWQARPSVTVRIPRGNVLDPVAVRQVAATKNSLVSRMREARR